MAFTLQLRQKGMALREQDLRFRSFSRPLQTPGQIELEITEVHLQAEVRGLVVLQVGMCLAQQVQGEEQIALVRIMERELPARTRQAAGRTRIVGLIRKALPLGYRPDRRLLGLVDVPK